MTLNKITHVECQGYTGTTTQLSQMVELFMCKGTVVKLVHKIKNNIVPEYLSSLFPRTTNESKNY